MGTKTIGLRDDTYKQLKARKQKEESFSDLIERLLDKTADWKEGFGTLDSKEMEKLEKLTEKSRTQTSIGLSKRQQNAIKELTKDEETS